MVCLTLYNKNLLLPACDGKEDEARASGRETPGGAVPHGAAAGREAVPRPGSLPAGATNLDAVVARCLCRCAASDAPHTQLAIAQRRSALALLRPYLDAEAGKTCRAKLPENGRAAVARRGGRRSLGGRGAVGRKAAR